MDCEKVRENLFDYIKNFISDEKSEKIKEHIAKCQNCREFYYDCEILSKSYPQYEKKFLFPEKLNKKIKKSLESLEKSSAL